MQRVFKVGFFGLMLGLSLACNYLTRLVVPPTPEPSPFVLAATRTLRPRPATRTPRPTLLPTLTPTVDLVARERYASLKVILGNYRDQGLIPAYSGQFKRLPDYSVASTEVGEYDWRPNYEPPVGNFIFQADIRLETAGAAAPHSACGLLFHILSSESHNYVLVDQAGLVTYGFKGVNALRTALGPLPNPATFTLTLIVYQRRVRILIDGEEVIADDQAFPNGSEQVWGPVVRPGSTQGFGTQCEFTQVSLARLPSK